MNRTERKEFNLDCELTYKNMIKALYLRWSGKMHQAQIREEFRFWISKHNHKKLLELISNRKHRKIKVKYLKDKVQELENKINITKQTEVV